MGKHFILRMPHSIQSVTGYFFRLENQSIRDDWFSLSEPCTEAFPRKMELGRKGGRGDRTTILK